MKYFKATFKNGHVATRQSEGHDYKTAIMVINSEKNTYNVYGFSSKVNPPMPSICPVSRYMSQKEKVEALEWKKRFTFEVAPATEITAKEYHTIRQEAK